MEPRSQNFKRGTKKLKLHRAIFIISIIFEVILIDSKAAPASDFPKSTFLLKPVQAVVDRGGTVDIHIDVVPSYGREVQFSLSSSPKFGSLTEGEKNTSALIFHYTNNKKYKSNTDAFTFRVKAPGHAWNTYTAEISIQNPPGTLLVQPTELNFGVVPMGVTSTKTVLLSNSFGANISGTLLIPPPWSISGESEYSLNEGESKSVTIEFTPEESVQYSAQLAVTPQMPDFPLINLTGSGTAPFLLTSTSLVVNSDNLTATISVSNTSKSPLSLGWKGDSNLDFSPDLTIPPDGVAQLWVSAKRINLPVEGEKVFYPLLQNEFFSQQLELTVHGPKGSVSLESLGGKEMLFTRIGKTASLEGIIRNKSSMNHMVTLSLQDKPGVSPLQSPVLKSMSVPPEQYVTFSIPWSPKKAGVCSPIVHLQENGKIISSTKWKFSVDPADNFNQVSPVVKVSKPIEWKPRNYDVPTPPSTERIRGASQQEKEMVVIWLPPRFQDGFFFRSLVFRWRYLGSDQAGFVLKEHHIDNALADRTGEHLDEWNLVGLKTVPEKLEQSGIWEQKAPLPYPGTHEYMISTAGPGEKLVSLQQITISWGLFLWPLIRLLLIFTGMVIVIKIIRRRNLW